MAERCGGHLSVRGAADLERFLAKHVEGLTVPWDAEASPARLDFLRPLLARIGKAAKAQREAGNKMGNEVPQLRKLLHDALTRLASDLGSLRDAPTKAAVIAWLRAGIASE